MSGSPFMTPSQSRERRRAAQRRRSRRRAAGVTLVALVLGLLALWLALAGSGGAHRGEHPAARSHPRPARPAPPALSPAGLALARPAFTLREPAAGTATPVRLRFHEPPSAGILFDLDTGRVLWQREPARRLPIASLTKMMTALLAVESSPSQAPVLVTRRAVAEGGSKVGVLPLGRRVPLQSMLYGLLLPSGNDAAVAIAEHVAGSIRGFVARMNARAAALGMACTRYSSPSGFYDAGNFSCPLDLALLAHEDLAQPRIARIVRTYTADLPFPIHGGRLYLDNNNPLLIYGYPGTTGLKTGYTLAAGRCLVATADRHGVRLGVVLLHSPAPGTQARKLLDAAFREVYHLPAVPEPPMPADA